MGDGPRPVVVEGHLDHAHDDRNDRRALAHGALEDYLARLVGLQLAGREQRPHDSVGHEMQGLELAKALQGAERDVPPHALVAVDEVHHLVAGQHKDLGGLQGNSSDPQVRTREYRHVAEDLVGPKVPGA